MRKIFCRGKVCLAALPVLLITFLVAGCGNLLTGDSSDGKKNWAVIVGVANYKDSSYNLKWADEDALDFYDALRRGRNWDSDKIFLLTNSAATKSAIRDVMGSLSTRVSNDDNFLFYFSGRGSSGPDQPPYDEGDGLDEYLSCYDAVSNQYSKDISDDELEAMISALQTNNIILVIDAGFSRGQARGSAHLRDKYIQRGNVSRSLDGMTRDLSRPGYLLLTAGHGGEPVYESDVLRNSPFTYYLVEGMGGAANPGKKVISVKDAFEYAASRASGFASAQHPQFTDNRGRSLRLLAFK